MNSHRLTQIRTDTSVPICVNLWPKTQTAMSEEKFRPIEMSFQEHNKRTRDTIDELLQQNRKIIDQNTLIIRNNIGMIEQLGKPLMTISGAIDPAADSKSPLEKGD